LSNYFYIKLVSSPEYHLWCDALHARELARTTTDDWSRGTYVRWTITSAFTVLEMCCKDALNVSQFSNGLKSGINQELIALRIPRIDWNNGIWKKVLDLRDVRNYYVHENAAQRELWPGQSKGEDAIITVRNAVCDIYQKVNKPSPNWINDDPINGFILDK
jgi:hypothetical protein